MTSETIINWRMTAGAMALLLIFTFIYLMKVQRVLRNKRINDVKFFIENGLGQIFDLALVLNKHNAELGHNVGIWESQLQNLLQSVSFGDLLSETISLEEEIRCVTRDTSNTAVGIALTGFRQIRKELKVLSQEKNEKDYNKLLRDVRNDFLEWRDKLKESERDFQISKGGNAAIQMCKKSGKKKKKAA